MAKRIADKELTDRNWDQEDEGEEAGTFSLASEDVMKTRAIKKARRRNAGAEGEGGGAFNAFKGFSLMTPPSEGSAPFPGFGNSAGFKPLSSLTNGNSAAPVTSAFGGFTTSATTKTSTGLGSAGSLTFNGPTSSKPSLAEVGDKQWNGSSPSSAASVGSSKGSGGGGSSEYTRQLTALNCSVRDWITKHVNDNPLCDLNPIFRDYERHLASIERKYGGGAGATETGPLSNAAKTSNSEGPAEGAKPGGIPPAKPTPLPSSSSSLTTTAPAGTSAPAAFSFGGAKSEQPRNTQTTDENGEEAESEEPPVPVVKEIKEKDAFYSKKCKLFYKKETEFKEKGVGTLHLKMVAENKLQLLIRADTNLGNILLNIMVSSSLPCSRTGKNNVMVVCVPNPAVDEKSPTTPVPMLIRVKTTEDAEELFKLLQEKKA
uniref:Nuclear pore complex protein Nup50 n=1 Tax=Denticeps clupeoides TaxID=299321 RepID=A0AAY4EFN7_9TELE